MKNTFSGKVKFVDTRSNIFLHKGATKVLAKVYIFKVQSIKTELLRRILDFADSFGTTNQLTPKYWFQFKQYFYKIYSISWLKLLPKDKKAPLWIQYTGIQLTERLCKYSAITHSLPDVFSLPESIPPNSS